MMSIKHDMTQEEPDQDKKLRAEAKDKQEIDKSGHFLYLVRGMPWERHIQKIKIRKAEQDLDQEGSVELINHKSSNQQRKLALFYF
jgi:hypothetical protein